MKELRECIKNRLDAELVSYCDLLGICISHKGKKSDSFKPDSEYIFPYFPCRRWQSRYILGSLRPYNL